MKNTASRSKFVLVLAGILLFGLLTFVIRYFMFADRWISHSHRSGTASIQKVTDRSGTVLYAPNEDQVYAKDAMVRKAALHLLGDREERIDALAIKQYIPQLVGFDKLNGTYGNEDGTGILELTVDGRIEAVALQALNGKKGTVGVYNYKTGEILCAISSPTFDPYDPPEITDANAEQYEGAYLHRFFSYTYTPGSIFKLVTVAAALENVPDITEQTFTCEGYVYVNGERINCQGGKAHGEQTLEQALANSCNCAFAEITQQVGAKNLINKVRQIGLTESMFVDGYYTKAGTFDKAFSEANNLAWAGIGQHTDMVNPCQYMTYMGAIANGGKAAMPYLVSSVESGGAQRYKARRTYTNSMITGSAARVLTEMMHNNVVKMYGAVNLPNVEVCAKSGTAERAGHENTATFAGFINDERYPLAFVVVVEEGGAGSAACAPIAAAVLKQCISVLNEES
ncbi:MAG: penicillin-binding protein [Oscillospiraceae bacterium]|nr:penicillin-binding protein [Oscillospiraceae bacterium]